MRWLVVPLVLVALLSASVPSRAQSTVSLTPDTITVTSEDGSPLVATFFLTPNAEVSTVDFLATDLAPEQANQRPILGAEVTFAPTALQDPEPNVRHQVLITIGTLTEAGSWSGELLIRWRPRQPADAGATQEIAVPLTVTSVVSPVLVLEAPSSVVAQGERGFSKYHSPDIRRSVTIRGAEDDVTATGLSVFVPDLQSTDQLQVFPGSEIETAILGDTGDPITNLSGAQRADVVLTFAPNSVPAGSYAGNLILQSTNAGDVSLPVEIDVKDWWLLPLAALGAGLALSYGFTYYRTRVKVKDELRVRLVRMQRNRAEGSDFGLHIGSHVDERLELAESHLRNDKPADAETLIAEVESLWNSWLLNRRQFIALIAQLQQQLTRTDGQTNPEVVTLRNAMTQVRDFELASYVADPAPLRTQIDAWRTSLDSLLGAGGQVQEALIAPGEPPTLDFWGWREPSRRLKLFALAVGLVGLLLLAWTGLQELYFNNSTFGSGGLGDYMKLFIWGFGVEATRTQIVTYLQGAGAIVPGTT